MPNLSDWTQTGKVLALLAAKHDYERVGQGRLTNDALVAMSAGRSGITVITANARDFARLAEFRFSGKSTHFEVVSMHRIACEGSAFPIRLLRQPLN